MIPKKTAHQPKETSKEAAKEKESAKPSKTGTPPGKAAPYGSSTCGSGMAAKKGGTCG